MRVSTASTYRRVLYGFRLNQNTMLRAQEQLSTGRRLLRPSDDPTDSSRAIQLERQIADVQRFRESIADGTRLLETSGAALEATSGLLIDARELLIQAMNGTLNDGDRESIGVEIGLIRRQLLDQANQRVGDHFVLGGAENESAPWEEVVEGGRARVVYRGDDSAIQARIGWEITADITLSGSSVFGRFEPQGTLYGGLTGAGAGTTVDEGTGFAYPEFRHDSTSPGALASVGLGLVLGGAQDTLLGSNALTIDTAAGTIQLGSGTAIPLPSTADADFVVTNELGGELHLDFTGFTGVDYTGTVTGNGSVSLDGTNFTAMTFAETDLEVVDDATGRTLHIDTTGVKRAGAEQVTFAGTTNLFDLMGAMESDLRNNEGNGADIVLQRLNQHLAEFDRHHSNTLEGTGLVGARNQRLQVAEQRIGDIEVRLRGMLSDVADADLSEVATELTQAEYLLQIAQASGARLIQTSLLGFLS